jgi:hypothetical protein
LSASLRELIAHEKARRAAAVQAIEIRRVIVEPVWTPDGRRLPNSVVAVYRSIDGRERVDLNVSEEELAELTAKHCADNWWEGVIDDMRANPFGSEDQAAVAETAVERARARISALKDRQ